jgi:hypothetical protein
MARFAANCKISGPTQVATPADVDFNGLQFSYTIGLMFPAQAAAERVPVLPPQAAATLPTPQVR